MMKRMDRGERIYASNLKIMVTALTEVIDELLEDTEIPKDETHLGRAFARG